MFTDTLYSPDCITYTRLFDNKAWNLTMALRADSFEQLPPKGHRTNPEA